jgi:hypothetical protein
MTANLMAIFVLCSAFLASACGRGQSGSASCNLEPPGLPKLLQAIKPLIEKGFSETEIDTVQRLAVSTPVKHTGTKTFPISYRGKDATIRVDLNKDDVDAPLSKTIPTVR